MDPTKIMQATEAAAASAATGSLISLFTVFPAGHFCWVLRGLECHIGAAFAADERHQRDLVGHYCRRVDRCRAYRCSFFQDHGFSRCRSGIGEYLWRLYRLAAHAADVPEEGLKRV